MINDGKNMLSSEVKVSFLLSFIVALLSESAIRFYELDIMSYVLCPIFNIMPFSINCSELDKDQARAWLYIFAMYTMILPILFWRMRYLLSEHVVPSQPLSKRLIISIIALFLGPILLFIPFIVMVLGADNLGRAGLIDFRHKSKNVQFI